MSDTPCQRCKNPALPGRACCHVHDPEFARERGRKGGRAKADADRAKREAIAAALRAGCVADLRATLEEAMRQAYIDCDWSTVISAVRAGIDLLKSGELEQQVRELTEKIESRLRRVN